MGKNKKLKKTIKEFVSQLTPEQLREQLALAYLQMELCIRALKGENVEPVEMMDNGHSSDLELFYSCKKSAAELAELNRVAARCSGKTIGFKVELDCGDAIRQLQMLRNFGGKKYFGVTMKYIEDEELIEFSDFGKNVDGFAIKLKDLFDFIEDECGYEINERGIIIGETPVYFFFQGKIHKNIISDVVGLEQGNGSPVFKIDGYESYFPKSSFFEHPEELVKDIKVNKHQSYEKGKPSGYIIDSTNRVFRCSKKYLIENKIEHHNTYDGLIKYLLNNIVRDEY